MRKGNVYLNFYAENGIESGLFPLINTCIMK